MNDIAQTSWFAGIPQNDLIILACGIAIFILCIFFVKRERLVILFVSLYLILALRILIPEMEEKLIGENSVNNYWIRLVMYGIILMVFFLFLDPNTLVAPIESDNRPWMFWIGGFLATGLLITIAIALMPTSMEHSLTKFTQFLFASVLAKLFWLLSGLVFFSFLSEKRSR